MNPLRKTLAQFFQEQPHPPVPTPPISPIEPQNLPRPDLVLPINEQQLPPIPNAQQQQQNNFDFPALVLAFCLTGAVEIAIQYRTVNPFIFHLLCLMVVFAFASIFVAKSIAPKHLNAARKFDSVGVFFGVTAFFFAVTISFPLCLRIISWVTYGLRIISWITYGLSFLTILISNRPGPLFSI